MKIKSIIRRFLYRMPSKYIVMFHHLSLNPKIDCSKCKTSTNKFIDFCVDNKKNIISMDKLCNGKIVLTFDDGLEDLYTIAFPFLRDNNIPFTFFVVTDFLDMPGYITTKQLIEMSQSSCATVGSHGTSHTIFTKMNEEQKLCELVNSKKKLEDLICKPVNYFAYSHGVYDSETPKLMGVYKRAFSTLNKPYNFFTCRNVYTIPRLNMDENNYEENIKIIKRK